MIKTLDKTLKQDKEPFVIPKSVQNTIPVRRIWPDGLFVHRKPLAGRVVQKRLLPMGKNKTPSVIVEMRSGNCKLQNKGRPLKSE